MWIAGQEIRELAQRIDLTPTEQSLQPPESPEQLLTELREAGFRPRQDLGTIRELAELRQIQQQEGITEIRVNAPTGQWYDGKIPNSYRLHHPRTHTFHVPAQPGGG